MIYFVQPFTVNAAFAAKCTGRTVVLDLAFNNDAKNYRCTTEAFIRDLGEKLVLWLDHHPHEHWKRYKKDTRFCLVDRAMAPACPPLITEALCARYGPADTIVCHGDFDGIMSAVKYSRGGNTDFYPELDRDSIAIDSRVGPPSERGLYYERALKADTRDDALRRALYTHLITGSHEPRISEAHDRYEAIEQETCRLATHYRVHSPLLCTLEIQSNKDLPGNRFDLTQLLLLGQQKARIAAVLHDRDHVRTWTLAAPVGTNLAACFHVEGMPNRITLLDSWELASIQARIETYFGDSYGS